MNANFPYIYTRDEISNYDKWVVDFMNPDFNFKEDIIEDVNIHYVIMESCDICENTNIHIDYNELFWGDRIFNNLMKKYNYRYEWITNTALSIIYDIDDPLIESEGD